MERTEEMENFLDDMTNILFGCPNRQGSIDSGKCVFCGEPAVEFKDELSRREFQISGLCQSCQDEVFTKDDEEEGDFYPSLF
jgi:radical SAM superfamily enzyme